jgi:hypothetical protein
MNARDELRIVLLIFRRQYSMTDEEIQQDNRTARFELLSCHHFLRGLHVPQIELELLYFSIRWNRFDIRRDLEVVDVLYTWL